MGLDQKNRQPVLSQSLFNTIHVHAAWRSYTTSALVHGILILVAALITVPVVREIERNHTAILVAPRIPKYAPSVPNPPKPSHSPIILVRNEIRPKPLPMPRLVEPEPVKVPKPQILAAAPEVKVAVPPATHQPVLEPKLAEAPRPAVKTGSFKTVELAKGPVTPKITKVGGFGDPNGVLPSPDSHPSEAMLAQIGSFDLPSGAGTAGGGGKASGGGVRQTNFGDADTGGVPGGTGHSSGKVQTGGFGDPPTVPPTSASASRPRQVEPVFTPVEILYKPKPTYTEEARKMRLEGQVSLDVVFLSTGSVRIIRVVQGLGHGLDEAAQKAAQQVRFRPATRGGVPVDTSATIRITFELT
jgi:TonB family protein